jgi:hypothetical protein
MENQSKAVAPVNGQSLTKDDAKMEDFKLRMAELEKILNADPPKREVKANRGVEYIPIGILEDKMDEIFGWGMWGHYAFTWEQIFNELAGSIMVEFYHPVTGKLIRRSGAAGVQIRLRKLSEEEKRAGINGLDPSRKVQNALEMDVAHLKADCLRNAITGIGKFFGRDLRRDDDKSGYYHKAKVARAEKEANALTEAIGKLQNVHTPQELFSLEKDYAHLNSRTEWTDAVTQRLEEISEGIEVEAEAGQVVMDLEGEGKS